MTIYCPYCEKYITATVNLDKKEGIVIKLACGHKRCKPTPTIPLNASEMPLKGVKTAETGITTPNLSEGQLPPIKQKEREI